MPPFRHAAARTGAWLWLAVLCCLPGAQAACTRPISAIYSSKRVAEIYGDPVGSGLPSLHDAIADRSGCTVRIMTEPPARAEDEFVAGRADLLIGSSNYRELAARNRFIAMLQSPWLLLTTAEAQGLPDRLEDFVGRRGLLIGRVRGGSYPTDVQTVLELLASHHQIDDAVDTDMVLKKLLAHRDAAVLISAAAFSVQPDPIRKAPLRRMTQSQFAPVVFGIFLNHDSLTGSDQQALAASINSLVGEGLPVRLMRLHARQEDEALLQSPH